MVQFQASAPPISKPPGDQGHVVNDIKCVERDVHVEHQSHSEETSKSTVTELPIREFLFTDADIRALNFVKDHSRLEERVNQLRAAVERLQRGDSTSSSFVSRELQLSVDTNRIDERWQIEINLLKAELEAKHCARCKILEEQLEEFRKKENEKKNGNDMKDETILRLRDENEKLRIELRAFTGGRGSPAQMTSFTGRSSPPLGIGFAPSPMNSSPPSGLAIPTMRQLKRGDQYLLPDIGTIRLALGWESRCDLDASVLMLTSEKRYYDHVYFGKKKSKDGAVIHRGDVLDNTLNQDNEVIDVNLQLITDSVVFVFFVITVYTPGQMLSEVKNSYCRLLKGPLGVPFLQYNLTENAGDNTAQIFVCIHRDTEHMGRWRVTALGEYCKGRSWNDVEPHCSRIAGRLADADSHWPSLLTWLRIQQREHKSSFLRHTSYLTSWGEEFPIPHHVSSVRMGLGWETQCDLDASIIVLDVEGRHYDHIYFGKKTSRDAAIVHRGDNLIGGDGGDDEAIDINLDRLSINTVFVFCVVTIYTTGQHFGQVRGAYCRLFDSTHIESPKVLTVPFAQFDLKSNASSATGEVFVCLYRDPSRLGCWKLVAIGESAEGRSCRDLQPSCGAFAQRIIAQESSRGWWEDLHAWIGRELHLVSERVAARHSPIPQ